MLRRTWAINGFLLTCGWVFWWLIVMLGDDGMAIWMFPKIVVPQNGWFIMENQTKYWWFGGTTIFGKHPYRVITIVGFQPSYNQLPFKAGEKYIPSDGVRVQLRVLEGSREFCPRGLINGFATKPRCRTLSLVFRNFKWQFTSHSVSLRMGFWIVPVVVRTLFLTRSSSHRESFQDFSNKHRVLEIYTPEN